MSINYQSKLEREVNEKVVICTTVGSVKFSDWVAQQGYSLVRYGDGRIGIIVEHGGC